MTSQRPSDPAVRHAIETGAQKLREMVTTASHSTCARVYREIAGQLCQSDEAGSKAKQYWQEVVDFGNLPDWPTKDEDLAADFRQWAGKMVFGMKDAKQIAKFIQGLATHIMQVSKEVN